MNEDDDTIGEKSIKTKEEMERFMVEKMMDGTLQSVGNKTRE